jgi:hypothetical protein
MRALDAGPLDELMRKYGGVRAAEGLASSTKIEPSVIFKLKAKPTPEDWVLASAHTFPFPRPRTYERLTGFDGGGPRAEVSFRDFFTHLGRKAKTPASPENVGSVLSPPVGRQRRVCGERIYGNLPDDTVHYLSPETTREHRSQEAEMGSRTGEDAGCPGFPTRTKARQGQNQPHPSLANILGSLPGRCVNDANFHGHLHVLGYFFSVSSIEILRRPFFPSRAWVLY